MPPDNERERVCHSKTKKKDEERCTKSPSQNVVDFFVPFKVQVDLVIKEKDLNRLYELVRCAHENELRSITWDREIMILISRVVYERHYTWQAHRATLDRLYAYVNEPDVLQICLERRFDLKLPASWPLAQLKQFYHDLLNMSPSHVAGVTCFVSKNSQGAGTQMTCVQDGVTRNNPTDSETTTDQEDFHPDSNQVCEINNLAQVREERAQAIKMEIELNGGTDGSRKYTTTQRKWIAQAILLISTEDLDETAIETTLRNNPDADPTIIEAIKAAQKSHNLAQTGVIGSVTLQALAPEVYAATGFDIDAAKRTYDEWLFGCDAPLTEEGRDVLFKALELTPGKINTILMSSRTTDIFVHRALWWQIANGTGVGPNGLLMESHFLMMGAQPRYESSGSPPSLPLALKFQVHPTAMGWINQLLFGENHKRKATIDAEFVQATMEYQAEHQITYTGCLDDDTLMAMAPEMFRLSKLNKPEIILSLKNYFSEHIFGKKPIIEPSHQDTLFRALRMSRSQAFDNHTPSDLLIHRALGLQISLRLAVKLDAKLGPDVFARIGVPTQKGYASWNADNIELHETDPLLVSYIKDNKGSLGDRMATISGSAESKHLADITGDRGITLFFAHLTGTREFKKFLMHVEKSNKSLFKKHFGCRTTNEVLSHLGLEGLVALDPDNSQHPTPYDATQNSVLIAMANSRNLDEFIEFVRDPDVKILQIPFYDTFSSQKVNVYIKYFEFPGSPLTVGSVALANAIGNSSSNGMTNFNKGKVDSQEEAQIEAVKVYIAAGVARGKQKTNKAIEAIRKAEGDEEAKKEAEKIKIGWEIYENVANEMINIGMEGKIKFGEVKRKNQKKWVEYLVINKFLEGVDKEHHELIPVPEHHLKRLIDTVDTYGYKWKTLSTDDK